jgi:microcystin-dependent protein
MESFIGQICLFPFNFAPTNWMPCTGQLVPISQNQALFSLLGTNFGGDGMTTFGLPNLQGKAPAPNLQYFIATNGVYPSRP